MRNSKSYGSKLKKTKNVLRQTRYRHNDLLMCPKLLLLVSSLLDACAGPHLCVEKKIRGKKVR